MPSMQLTQPSISHNRLFNPLKPNIRSIWRRIQQTLTNQQLNQHMVIALNTSYSQWTQRYGTRAAALLNEHELHTKTLIRLCSDVSKITDPSPSDVATALANLLCDCTGCACSSFASFPPELADYVCLFENELRKQRKEPIMMQSLLRPSSANRFVLSSITKSAQHRLFLWGISLLLLFIAGLFLNDSIQNSSLIGLLFSGSWIVTILVNALFIDYLLRPKSKK